MAVTPTQQWTPTRTAGLERLRAFLPRAGRRYASERNYDAGPQQRSGVSTLSPWIRHRLITEQEVVAAVSRTHSPESTQKFVQEVCWRTYWKGWLEMHPGVWRDYRAAVSALAQQLTDDTNLRSRWQDATSGNTGIDGFDDWARELIDTGYLHNHARMWFASIWVFTLDLPWELGADFFLRNLLDGDAASNTLSWRWVAGLQTPGKLYLARADNIARYTRGRFHPRGQLKEHAEAVASARAHPAPRSLAPPMAPVSGRRTGLLLSEDDLCPESLDLSNPDLVAAAAFGRAGKRSPWGVSSLASEFSEGALDDGLARAGTHFQIETSRLPGDALAAELLAWCDRSNLAQVIVPCVPIGFAADSLRPAIQALQATGIHCAEIRRPWDVQLWPHATHGYFRFKRHIEPLVVALTG